MKKYQVTYAQVQLITCQVEADNPKEAAEAAIDDLYSEVHAESGNILTGSEFAAVVYEMHDSWEHPFDDGVFVELVKDSSGRVVAGEIKGR